ncbi:MAG: PAS domain-containing sensor histidine kinase [Cyclobacteriaceae bacterium]|nr:PAS domain-containing sensor histidine kinase [Cyclobacteriaceae bacterium]
MSLKLLKAEMLNLKAQIITFESTGKLLSSCNTLFFIPKKEYDKLFNIFPVLESLQFSFEAMEKNETFKLPCIWLDSFGVSGYYDFTFRKEGNLILWLIQDFDEIYRKNIVVQQERNDSLINSELVELQRETREELKKAEETYKYLFDNTLDLIQSIDANGRFVFVNPAWLKTLKYTEEELSEITFLDIVHPDDGLHCKELFESLHKKKIYKDVEVRFLDRNGEIVYVKGSINSIFKEGKLLSNQAIFKDVTKSKLAEERLKESEVLYRLLVENASDIIYKTNMEGRITFMNDVGLKSTGYTVSEIGSINFVEWVHPDYRTKIKNFYFSQFENKVNSTYREFPIILQNSTEIWIGQKANLLFETINGKERIVGFLVIIRDITQQKEIENTLNNAKNLLEQRVEERTLALRQSNLELNLVNKDLDSFLYKSSHNLKGPIARILGLLNLIKLEKKPSEIPHYIDYIEKEATIMNHLTDQLTAYHNIYSYESSESAEKIDLESLLKTLLYKQKKTLESIPFKYNIDIKESIQLYCNRALLTLVLENILDNALQYNKGKKRSGHQINLKAQLLNEWVEIKIRDNGEGISNEILDDIFTMFYKGNLTSEGNGLGLFLVLKAVKKLDGKIEVNSSIGQFSEFRILLPKQMLTININ